jgi:hypothetical protein
MPPSLDAEIDALYQLPLDEFTAKRNALAKTAGARADEVRKLAKPKAAAWAVNQLYWSHRAVFDKLVKAASAARQAHVAKIGGKAANVARLEAEHQAALDAAIRQATSILETAGSASPPTLLSVERTLRAVPSAEIAGRLTDPVESVGFGLLSELLQGGAGRGLADVVSLNRGARPSPQAPAKPAAPLGKAERAAAERRSKAEAGARRQERQKLERELKDAVRADEAAKSAFNRAKKSVADADARIERLEDDLRAARVEADRRRNDVERLRGEANDAASTRVLRERALRLLGD